MIETFIPYCNMNTKQCSIDTKEPASQKTLLTKFHTCGSVWR